MKFLCLGYFSPQKMDALPKPKIDAVMRECWSHVKEFSSTGQVIVDAGLELQTTCLRRANGVLEVTDSPSTESGVIVGSVFIIEARDMDDAISVVSLHPSMRVSAGEQLGWRIEMRSIHYFESQYSESSQRVGALFNYCSRFSPTAGRRLKLFF